LVLPDSAYLDLLKKSLTASLYDESAWQVVDGPMTNVKGLVASLKRQFVSALKRRGLLIVRAKQYRAELREQGLDWPLFGLTMVGLRRLNNVQFCIEDVLAKGVPGDFVETGVWRGGSSILAKAVLRHHGANDRVVWCCDSFEGMPTAKEKDLSLQSNSDFSDRDYLVATQEQVANNFRKFDLLDDNVKFLKGWFCDTLPSAPIKQISILRMDGDLYESTMDALANLYAKVSIGGYLIVDDYKSWNGCRTAIDEFRKQRGIEDVIEDIDAHAVYWRRTQ
jgi:O-methyltransferase